MSIPFYHRGEKPRLGRWWAGLLLAGLLGFLGCKSNSVPRDGLRENDLAEAARQARARVNGSFRDTKHVDDPWMSEKAQKIARDLQ